MPDKTPIDVDPAAERGALGDGVVDEHLVVAGSKVGVRRVRARATGDDIGVDRPEERAERVAEALDMAARQRRRGCRISFGRSRWPSHRWSGVSESHQAALSDPSTSHWSEFFRPALICDTATRPRAPLAKRRRSVAVSSVPIGRVTVSADRSVENVSTGPVGSWRAITNVARSAITETIG